MGMQRVPLSRTEINHVSHLRSMSSDTKYYKTNLELSIVVPETVKMSGTEHVPIQIVHAVF